MTQILRILSICLLVASCATSPEGRKQLVFVPDSQMMQMGQQGFADLKTKMKVETDPAINRYVQCIAQNILRVADPVHKDWEVVVFKEDSANAFALPGRKIGVHTGILPMAKSADQLAAVIGHEVGHVLANHGAERVSEALAAQGGLLIIDTVIKTKKVAQNDILMAALGLGVQGLVLLPHSRAQESEADIVGLRLMSKAGFNPSEAVQLWRNMKAASGKAPPEFLSTHPANDTRIRNLESHLPDVMPAFKAAPVHPNCERPS